MSKREVLEFGVLREEISPENVLAMSECIAFGETRYLIGHMGTRMQKVFNALCVDILHKNESNRALSDGYDLVQECALYLCEHYGEHLSDIVGYTKKGKPITIRIAAVKKMTKLIGRASRDSYRNVSLEALTPVSEPAIEIQEETEYDYTMSDSIVENLNLTDKMREALECRMAGLSYPEIGRILERATSTVYEYFTKMRQRYMAIYG